tara:strand:+ start:112 stop:1113 length:1002 start_codon:yes stop_codon:yes gene_type:complete
MATIRALLLQSAAMQTPSKIVSPQRDVPQPDGRGTQFDHVDCLKVFDDTLEQEEAAGRASAFRLKGCDLLQRPGYLVWNEEFGAKWSPPDGTPNPNLWTFQVGRGENGWGNNEWQTYEEGIAKVKNGVLSIPVQWHGRADDRYTSARMVSKFSFQYGRVDVKAKFARTSGLWSAIWMLPDNPVCTAGGQSGEVWPWGGEIDIMEVVAKDPAVVHGTVHTETYNHLKGTQQGRMARVKDPDNWHIYTVVWDKDMIQFAIDGFVYNRYDNDHRGDCRTWPFDRPFHIIMNVAVGGNWGANYGPNGEQYVHHEEMRAGAADPRNTMQVDWIRVFSR